MLSLGRTTNDDQGDNFTHITVAIERQVVKMTTTSSGRVLSMQNRLPSPLLLIASALLTACTSQLPSDGSYDRFMRLAGDLEKRGDAATAASLYEKAAQEPGSHLDAWLKLGETRLASDDARGAERAYQQALELKPGAPDALLGLGTALVRLGKLDRAVTALTQAADTGDQPEAWNGLGIAQILRGHAQDAQAAFNKSLTLAPNDLDTRCNLALAYALGGQKQQALEEIHSVSQSPRAQPRHQRNELLITVLAGRERDVAGMALEDIPAADRKALLVEARRIKAIKDPVVQARELGLVSSH